MTAAIGENLRKALLSVTPLGRLGTPDEIAALALFLASDDGGFVTGQAISPNGGIVI
jgi:3-oxoacyl-[acyl-carrier protein] reductase